MKIYGDLESLSKNSLEKVLNTSRKIIELGINVEAEVTSDGVIYHLFVDDEEVVIYDDVLYDIFLYTQYYYVLDLYIQVYLNSKYEYKPIVLKVDEMLAKLGVEHYIHKNGISMKMIDDKLNFKINTYKEFINSKSKHSFYNRIKSYEYNTDNIYTIDFPIYCVYRFLDENNDILYIGKTSNICTRMEQHFISKSTLQPYVYDKVVKIEYIICKDEQDMTEKEKYFISKYKDTIYNKTLYNCKVNSDYDSIVWSNEYPVPVKNN